MIFRKGAIFQPLINKKYNVQKKVFIRRSRWASNAEVEPKQTYRVYSKELLSVGDVLIAFSMHLQTWKLYVELWAY